uniref:Uncharacterized protein n=1 Tax=Arundo donax TaxID=35708 RepID=A0A0A9G9Z1_ARUDO
MTSFAALCAPTARAPGVPCAPAESRVTAGSEDELGVGGGGGRSGTWRGGGARGKARAGRRGWGGMARSGQVEELGAGAGARIR